MSPDRLSTKDVSANVQTQIPIERSHVILQEQQQQPQQPTSQQHFILNNNNNNFPNKNQILNLDSVSICNKSNDIMTTQIASNQNSAINTTATTTTKFAVMDEKPENLSVGNIGILTTEEMEMSDNEQNGGDEIDSGGGTKINNSNEKISTDEELTPLHWLHDKNLLKGINLSCPKVRTLPEAGCHNNNNTNGESGGTISPNSSDSRDDSGVSEDNNFSVNSSSDQNGILSIDSSPKSLNYPIENYQTSSKITSNIKEISQYNSNNSNSNNNNQSMIITTFNQQKLLQQHQKQKNTSLILSGQQQKIEESYPQTQIHYNSNFNSNNIINNIQTSQSGTLTSPTNASSNNISSSYTHFHKKYLREQLKQQEAQDDVVKSVQSVQQVPIHHNQMDVMPSMQSVITKNEYKTYISEKDVHSFEQSDIEITGKGSDHGTKMMIVDKYSSSSSTSSTSSSPSPKIKHPNNVPYDPLIHTTSKPPYSFSSLIFMAIEGSAQKALPVKEIYAWIVQHFPYFKTAPTGWKNSVRHNLSLNKCFQKVEKAANLGKGSLWMVEPQYRPNLIQALTRSPFHPCSTLEKNSYKSSTMKQGQISESPPPNSKQQFVSNSATARLPNPEHFPFLSRRLAAMEATYNTDDGQSCSNSPSREHYDNHFGHGQSINYYGTEGEQSTVIYHNNNSIIVNGNLENPEITGRDISADTLEDVNAATAMLALKHGPKIFSENFSHPPVIISSPSEDHTYSAGNGGKHESTNGGDNQSNGTSSDAAYESSEESQVLNEQELEEQRRQAEGVDALLNLAGYQTNTTLLLKRPTATGHYFYATEISSLPSMENQSRIYYNREENNVNDGPPVKRLKTRNIRTKLKKKNWYR